MKKYRRAYFLLIFLFCLNVIAWGVAGGLLDNRMEITFFDVGQGDSIFIETPEGYQILIDGGPSSVVLEKLGNEMPIGDRTIDLIVLTHPEHDHYGGLIDVLESYKVENILWTGVLNSSDEYKKWKELIKKEGADITIAKAGQVVRGEDFYIEVIYPFELIEGTEASNINNSSVVLKLSHGENEILFTGDISKSVEKKIISKGVDSEVLKVSHHGSKTSSDESFVKAVSPEAAVIQCGEENKFGHPHKETLDTLNRCGINILRTDEQGDIKIVSNGSDFEIIIN